GGLSEVGHPALEGTEDGFGAADRLLEFGGGEDHLAEAFDGGAGGSELEDGAQLEPGARRGDEGAVEVVGGAAGLAQPGGVGADEGGAGRGADRLGVGVHLDVAVGGVDRPADLAGDADGVGVDLDRAVGGVDGGVDVARDVGGGRVDDDRGVRARHARLDGAADDLGDAFGVDDDDDVERHGGPGRGQQVAAERVGDAAGDALGGGEGVVDAGGSGGSCAECRIDEPGAGGDFPDGAGVRVDLDGGVSGLDGVGDGVGDLAGLA